MSHIPTEYVPTTYAEPNDGDATFWGTLLKPGPEFAPSDIFPRLTDSLFFYLDEHAAPQRSNHIEPSKLAYWYQNVNRQAMDPNAVDATNRIHFNDWMIPIRLVIARMGDPQGGQQIAVLDRFGFMMYMLSLVRGDPDAMFTTFRSSISIFGLCDPMTRLRFPLIPRSALPSMADPQAQQRNAFIAQKTQDKAKQIVEEARMIAEISRRGNEAAVSAISGTYTYSYI